MIDLVFEDNHLLIVKKPVNTPSQGDISGDMDMLTLCKNYLKEAHNKPGDAYCGLVHRLDRPVGGLMVFAKTSKAASRLSDQIRQKKMNKRYIAKIEGDLLEESGTLHHFLSFFTKKNMTTVFKTEAPNSKEAVLHFKRLEHSKEFSLVEVDLVTGRSHQIRAQFSFIGHPLVGDKKYGAKEKLKGIALYSSLLEFKHPTKDEIISFKDTPSWL